MANEIPVVTFIELMPIASPSYTPRKKKTTFKQIMK
jgi:hypothetical protein